MTVKDIGNRVAPPYPNALMLNNGDYNSHVPYSPSPWSRSQCGFQDTDSDGKPDILDTLPALTGTNAGSDPAEGTDKRASPIQFSIMERQDCGLAVGPTLSIQRFRR